MKRITSDKISLETRRRGTLYIYKELQEAIQISVYLCTIYGVVIIEVHKCNKELYLSYTVALYPSLYCLSVQRLGNPKMSVVYCGAPIHIYMQHLTPRQP